MNIWFSYQAQDDLGRLPLDMQERIRDKIQFFMMQSNIFTFTEYLSIEKCYRFRVGNQRLKFVIENNEAKIITVEPRDKAYKLRYRIK